jgi:hypothetical protein
MKEINKENLVKNNPFDLSNGSVNKMKLVGTLNAIVAKSYTEILDELFMEINKYRDGSFEFISNEFKSIKNENRLTKDKEQDILETYSLKQLEIINQIFNDIECLLTNRLPNSEELFGKTDTN